MIEFKIKVFNSGETNHGAFFEGESINDRLVLSLDLVMLNDFNL